MLSSRELNTKVAELKQFTNDFKNLRQNHCIKFYVYTSDGNGGGVRWHVKQETAKVLDDVFNGKVKKWLINPETGIRYTQVQFNSGSILQLLLYSAKHDRLIHDLNSLSEKFIVEALFLEDYTSTVIRPSILNTPNAS
jgi:hypothetical protein